jgi:hypothetical protein
MPSLRIYAILPTLTANQNGSGGNLGVDNPEVVPAGVRLPKPIVIAAVQTSLSRVINGSPLMIFDIPQVVNLTYPGYTAYEGVMRNNYGANRTDFRLVRGVRNEVIFFIRDIDRKPVALSMGDEVIIVITDIECQQLLMQRSLTVQDSAKGIYMLSTLPDEMDTWPTGPVKWSMNYTRASDGATVMLWTDQNYGVYSAAYVIESPYPGPAAITTLQWSAFILNNSDGKYYSTGLPASATNGYQGGMQTFVVSMTSFVGTIRFDAALVTNPESNDWFAVQTNTYTGTLSQDVINIQGNYLWMRVVITLTGGTISQIEYKN